MLRVSRLLRVGSEVGFRVADGDVEGIGTVLHCGNIGNHFLVGVKFTQQPRARRMGTDSEQGVEAGEDLEGVGDVEDVGFAVGPAAVGV